MCGIAGIFAESLAPETRRSQVEKMCELMAYRGPDSAGVINRGNVSLGACRLAIFDPALGRQPMTSPDGRHLLVFNGAIYNFRELRRELETAGAIFSTHCDTEVVLAAWTKWGQACVPRLRGMFAFAIWDISTQTLSLVRDQFGIKPLYFARRGARIGFASELKALSAGLEEPLTIDPVSIGQYLGWLAVPAPRTIFRDVRSLRPGEIATFRGGRLDLAWWSRCASPSGVARCKTRDEFTRELRSRLEDTIRAHSLADVPVGAFLSGGLDSSSIVALMARQAGMRLQTFSIGFHEPDCDESKRAEEIARHLHTKHQTRVVTGEDLAAELPRILAAMDQPTGDGINTYLASQAAREGGVKVALSGLGADELFGGYPSFRQVPAILRWTALWQKLPASGRRVILKQLRSRNTGARKLADLLEHGRNIHEICALQRRVFGSEQMLALLNPELSELHSATSWYHPTLPHLRENSDRDSGDVYAIVSQWERETYMVDVLLRDSDVMSMRHSLELRVPFVDQSLVTWLSQQPPALRFDSARPKSVLFDALRDLLPPELEHQRKRGFTLPFAHWMKQTLRPFLDETFSTTSLRRSSCFSVAEAQGLWRSYLENSDTRQWSRVWSLAMLVHFTNRFSAPVGTILPRAMEDAVSATRVQPNGSDGTARSKEERLVHRQRMKRRFLLLAPELFAHEGGIARMLQLYLRALYESAEPDGGVRFVSLNDSPQEVEKGANGYLAAKGLEPRDEGTAPTLDESISQCFVGCGGDKSLFVRSTLQLAPVCEDLICGHVAQLPVAQLAKTVNPRLRISLVAHGIEVWRPFTPAEKLALEQTDVVLCVSRYTRDEMSRWISLPRSRFAILPNALDPRLVFEASLPARPVAPVVLSISRLDSGDRYKGIDDLLRAMPSVCTRIPGATLRIIGRGNDLPRLQRLREELALGNAVEFLGYCSDETVAAELSRCSIFALPSTQEGFGLVFLEAMAAGRPCVGVQGGAVPELITVGTGILVQPNNVSALAHACIDALERTWDHSAIIARAQEFSYPIFKERLSSLFLSSSTAGANPFLTHP